MAPSKINYNNVEGQVSFTDPNDLRIGKYAMIRGEPCKISDLAKSAPGKHGASKIHAVGYQIFTDKKKEEIFTSGERVVVPDVTKDEYEVLSEDMEDGGYILVMKPRVGAFRMPAPKEEEHRDKIKELLEEEKIVVVTVLEAMNQQMVLTVREVSAPKKE